MTRGNETGSVGYRVFLFLILSVSIANASDIGVSQSIDKTAMAFEDVVVFEIELTWQGTQLSYLFDKPLNPEFDQFKVRKFSSSISSSGVGEEERTTKRMKFTLEPTASGLTSIPALTIEYLAWPDSIPGELVTEMMAVTIAEPLPVVETEAGALSVSTKIIAIVVVLVAATVVAFVVRRRKPIKVAKSPREDFLENLARSKEDAMGDLKKLQIGVYRHLVTYLGAEYSLALTGMTSEEIMSVLGKTDMPSNHRERIIGWLTRAEKEKFSPVAAAPGEATRLESDIRLFFENI
jgi:hypothetical protein